MKHIILCALIAFSSVSASAQQIIRETDTAFLRSQEIRGEAITAFRENDLNTAKTRMMEALQHRPNSIALLGNAIFINAETGDTKTAADLAERLIKMGVNPGAAVQAKLQEVLEPDTWLKLEEKIAVNAKPTGKPITIATIPTTHRLVEGITAAPNGTLYFSTVVSGSVLKLNADGELATLFDGQAYGLGSFFGIAFNHATNSLFATFATIDQTPENKNNTGDTGVAEIDPETGKLLNKWVLPVEPKGHQIADVSITAEGAVYLADAPGNKLYTIKGGTLHAVQTTAAFMNLQGLVAYSETDLLVADYGRGIWHVRTDTGDATLYGVTSDISVTGIDGLFHHKGRIIAVQNGTAPHRVIEVQLDRNQNIVTGITVLAQNLASFDEPTLGTSTADGFIFVASSQWPKFGSGGALREGAALNPTTILKIADN